MNEFVRTLLAPITTSLNNSNSEDTEITLGTGKMLALFFGLVILCAIFFGMGYSMGKNSVKSTAELLPSPSASHAGRPSASANRAGNTPTSEPESNAADQQSQPGTSAANNTPSSPDQPAATPVQPGTGYYVQVAAVSKQEDAEALVESLKSKQYTAFIANPSPDKLFHVQVGPFTDIKDAESTRIKLVSDGYNPILKK